MPLDPRSPDLSQAPTTTLCSPFVEALGVGGASMVVFGFQRQQLTVCTTDPIAARLDALQFELGEGPHWDVLGNGMPALYPDLHRDVHTPWPVLAESARALGIGAMFAFPMTIGAATAGAVDLYCLESRRLDTHQVSLGSFMANRVAATAVKVGTELAAATGPVETLSAPALRREVHQATGVIQAQLNTTATDAFARLRAHAFSVGRPVEQIAQDVVGKKLDFSDLPD